MAEDGIRITVERSPAWVRMLLPALLCLPGIIFGLPYMAFASERSAARGEASDRLTRVLALTDRAERLEAEGRSAEARAVREQVLAAVLEIWALDQDRVALLWAARTLQNRLDRPTAALQAALRFLTETYRRDSRLDADDETRLADAVAVVGQALAAQSRAEADPEAATRCIGLRPAGLGQMIVPGVDGDDRVYLYRDGPDGQVYVSECEPADVMGPVVGDGGGGGTALLVSGLVLAALGGGAFGMAAWADSRAQDVADEGRTDLHPESHYRDLENDFQVGGCVGLGVGGALLLTGAIWSLVDDSGPAEVRPLLDPVSRSAGMGIVF